jgi:hypothetical protein
MLFVLEKLNCKDVYFMSQMNVTSPPIPINPLKTPAIRPAPIVPVYISGTRDL